MELKIEYISVDELKPYERNTRKHAKKDVDNIAKSIEKYGFNDAIGIWKDNIIIEGHGRLLAAKQLGIDKVPCVRLDHLTDQERREYAIAHNATAELSEWDDILSDELSDLCMTDFDFDFGIEEEEEETEIIEDEAPEVDEENEPICQLGDIWQLGEHCLMCGDSTSADDVSRLMGGQMADMLLTDPPYNCNVGACKRPNSSNNNVHILNDNMDEQTFISFLSKALKNANDNMRCGAAFYIWYAGLHHIEFETALRAIENFKLHEQLVWVKSHFVLGRNSDYQWMHELCLYGWKTGDIHYFTDSRSEATVIEDKAVKLSTMKKGDLIALCEKMLGITKSTTVLRADKPNTADLHPTVKPQSLMCELLKNSSTSKQNVLDLFGGSGSTLIACEQLNRKCYMMELDPHYCDVVIKRWENLTGQKAVKIN